MNTANLWGRPPQNNSDFDGKYREYVPSIYVDFTDSIELMAKVQEESDSLQLEDMPTDVEGASQTSHQFQPKFPSCNSRYGSSWFVTEATGYKNFFYNFNKELTGGEDGPSRMTSGKTSLW